MAHFFIHASVCAQGAGNVQGVDFTGLATFSRVVEKTYPVAGAADLFVSHGSGAIRVLGWDQQVVRVKANIEVGAENAIQAERFAQKVEISGNHVGDRLEVRTVYPLIEPDAKRWYTADLEISVPRNTRLSLVNNWGDIFVSGTSGDVTLDSQYGNIDLTDISGVVRARAKGAFVLRAVGLHKGGSFFLRSTEAYFEDVSGSLYVNNYLGPIEIRAPGEQVDMDVISESGPIHLYLPFDSSPNIETSVEFGSIESDLLLNSETWGERTQSRLVNPQSSQHFDLDASFESIYIHVSESEPAVAALSQGPSKPIQEDITLTYSAAPGLEILIDAAMFGDVRVEGVDSQGIELTATRIVRVSDVDKVQMALEGLALRVEESPERLKIATSVQDDMVALGCTSYRYDLLIRCPKSTLIHVVAEDGHTYVVDMNSTVVVEQAQGKVTLKNIQNSVQVTNAFGDIEVSDISGMLTANGTRGTISVRNVKRDLDITCDQGKTIIESPGAAVRVRNSGGDVRIIALEGILGDYEVFTENGNISMAIPSTADAWLILNVDGGTIYSTFQLAGTSERDTHAVQGQLNGGTHRVVLETHQGSIQID
ncbi:MAG: DUF4097 family beta strand repeat-containing protein [Candidatus Hydrogenedentes bacterium]|nr:DUF4097 family beta strand repeat-containing protein [Candidatus Hydrogenedentota bacterium]